VVQETVAFTKKFSQLHMDSTHVGSILKVVAGTPDASNLERSMFLETRLVDANKGHIEMNTKVQNLINQLTSIVNLILETAKGESAKNVHC